MAMFRGFKPQGLQKIANRLGYTGAMQTLITFLNKTLKRKDK